MGLLRLLVHRHALDRPVRQAPRGPRAPEEAEKLWGVGFRHKDSHDVFLALWLDTGPKAARRSATTASPRSTTPATASSGAGTRCTTPAQGGHVGPPAQRVLFVFDDVAGRGSRRCDTGYFIPSRSGRAAPAKAARDGSLARRGETAETAPLKPAIWRTLNEVTDDQLYTLKSGIVDLGCVYDLRLARALPT